MVEEIDADAGELEKVLGVQAAVMGFNLQATQIFQLGEIFECVLTFLERIPREIDRQFIEIINRGERLYQNLYLCILKVIILKI